MSLRLRADSAADYEDTTRQAGPAARVEMFGHTPEGRSAEDRTSWHSRIPAGDGARVTLADHFCCPAARDEKPGRSLRANPTVLKLTLKSTSTVTLWGRWPMHRSTQSWRAT